MPQFFVDQLPALGENFELHGKEAKHILGSLRLTPGDELKLSDGKGISFRAKILSTSGLSLTMTLIEKDPPRHIERWPVLAAAVIKHDRFEWLIQKSVELGVKEILPFSSARIIPQFTDVSGSRKQGRWQKIAEEAAKQSGLPFRPSISPVQPLSRVLSRSNEFSSFLFFWEGETECSVEKNILTTHGDVLLVIGPEGGFTSQEVAEAKASGGESVSLGAQILRVETAAVAAVSILQHTLGNLSR